MNVSAVATSNPLPPAAGVFEHPLRVQRRTRPESPSSHARSAIR